MITNAVFVPNTDFKAMGDFILKGIQECMYAGEEYITFRFKNIPFTTLLKLEQVFKDKQYQVYILVVDETDKDGMGTHDPKVLTYFKVMWHLPEKLKAEYISEYVS